MRLPALMTVLYIVLLFFSCAGAAAQSTPENLAEAYCQAVLRDDWPKAQALWLPADISASRRLNIHYNDQPFKLDSASLIILERTRIQSGEIAVSVENIINCGQFAQIQFLLQFGDQETSANYYAVRRGGIWHLANPTTVLAADWYQKETEFLDLYIQPPRQISEEAVRKLDGFIAETCGRLGVFPARVELLRARKLRYYICDEATVAEIVGAPTRGAALLQTDAVVTSEPCHLHELAHLLVNFAVQELPQYTMPFLQEGIAVALGGRWGRAPEVMQGLGKFTLQSGMLDWEELLTWNEFKSQLADWTYAPSGVLAGFLLDTFGGERFLNLYGQLSGGLSDLQRLDQKTIQDRICTAAGMNWETLKSQFSDHIGQLPCGGILPAVDSFGDIEARLQKEGVVVTVTGDDQWLHWVVEAEKSPSDCAILLHKPDLGSGRPCIPRTTSRLFAEQFPNQEYSGELMAMVFAPEEVGIYDFRTDLLVAKFVESFCPEQSLATDGGTQLRFKIRRDLLPNTPWNAELVLNMR